MSNVLGFVASCATGIMLLSSCGAERTMIDTTSLPHAMQLTSSAFADGGTIPVKYTCDGEEASPPLHLEDVPADAESLVLLMEDPDAPSGNFVHWIAWNIPPTFRDLAENGVLPSGSLEGSTSAGRRGYIGPCPPSGSHRYQFRVYAVGKTIQIGEYEGKPAVMNAIEGNIVDEALLTGTYAR